MMMQPNNNMYRENNNDNLVQYTAATTTANAYGIAAAANWEQQQQNRIEPNIKQNKCHCYTIKYSFSNTKQRSFQYHMIRSYCFPIGRAIGLKRMEDGLLFFFQIILVMNALYMHRTSLRNCSQTLDMHHTCTVQCTIHAPYMHHTTISN